MYHWKITIKSDSPYKPGRKKALSPSAVVNAGQPKRCSNGWLHSGQYVYTIYIYVCTNYGCIWSVVVSMENLGCSFWLLNMGLWYRWPISRWCLRFTYSKWWFPTAMLNKRRVMAGEFKHILTSSHRMMIPTDQYGLLSPSLADKVFDPCKHMQHS